MLKKKKEATHYLAFNASLAYLASNEKAEMCLGLERESHT